MRTVGKYLMKAFMWLISKLPLKVHYFNSGFISWLAGDVIKYRRKVVRDNLRQSFPEKSEKDIDILVGQFYDHFADIIVEAFWFGGCKDPRRLREAHIMEIVNPELLSDLYENSPSIMTLYTHCGNWELYGGLESYNYTDVEFPFRADNICVVYKEMSSQMWDEIMRDNRLAPLKDKKGFSGYVESKNLVRYAFTHKDSKILYNVNTDQRPYYTGSDAISVNFMHRECRTMSAAAAIARKFGMSVVYLKMSIASRGHYLLEYIPICSNAKDMSVEEIMRKYYELLEAEITEQPFNYLWSHKRWA